MEPSGSIKCCEIIELLHNWWRLEQCSAPYGEREREREREILREEKELAEQANCLLLAQLGS
jgi:hypothetical protein